MHHESYASSKKGKTGIRRIINACGYSMDGLAAAYRHESAFRQLCWLNLGLIILAFSLDFELSVRVLLIIASFVSLIVELFNTPSKRPSITPPPQNTSWPSAPRTPVLLPSLPRWSCSRPYGCRPCGMSTCNGSDI